ERRYTDSVEYRCSATNPHADGNTQDLEDTLTWPNQMRQDFFKPEDTPVDEPEDGCADTANDQQSSKCCQTSQCRDNLADYKPAKGGNHEPMTHIAEHRPIKQWKGY